MAADGRVRVTLPVRYRAILQRHRGSMSDASFLSWMLDNIDRGVLSVGIEPGPAAVAPEIAMNGLPPAKVVSVVDALDEDDEFEDVI
ncbi:MAG: hypothetical protein AAFN12_15165 [Cyanobacteria bacterium J06560_2]